MISLNQHIDLPVCQVNGVELFLKREDEIDPIVSGNKWRKLKYNLILAKESGKKEVLSFGGAYSNHIVAVAKATRDAGLGCKLMIRGDGYDESNPTLAKVKEFGANCEFLSRSVYRQVVREGIHHSRADTEDFYVIPEGGSNLLGVKGCQEILTQEDSSFDIIASAQGTGGTIAGLLLSLGSHQRLLSFPALKGDFFESDIAAILKQTTDVQASAKLMTRLEVIKEYHFGGYAKWNSELIDFMRDFQSSTRIHLDPIYTGKMMYGLVDMIAQSRFAEGTRILAIHTGGLQGIKGFEQRFGFEIYPQP